MAGRAGFRYGLAAGLLALLTGCTTAPTALPAVASVADNANPPAKWAAQQLPLSVSATAPSIAPSIASVIAPSIEPSTPPSAAPVTSDAVQPPPVAQPMSALADFIARRFRRGMGSTQAPPTPPEPTPAEPPEPDADTSADKKYQLSGDQARELERGKASWYGTKFHGRLTANGEIYDKAALTAAHKTLPFGTIVRVRSLALGTEVDVRINDRGPFAPGRVIDVSQAAAEALGLTGAGVATVSLKVTATALRNFKVLPSSRKRHASARRSAPPMRHASPPKPLKKKHR